jgi:hypothetical protein
VVQEESNKIYFIIFGHSLHISMNFASLRQFLEFKQLKNDLKSPHSVTGIWPAATVHSVAAGRKADWVTAWRPGPAAEAARELRARCARVGVVTVRGTARWLSGG